MPVKYAGIALTDVDTEAKAPLGQIVEVWDDTYGEQTWIYVFNDEASTPFAAGVICARDAGTATPGDAIVAPQSCPSARVMGVAQHAIPAGSYGWIQRTGAGALVKADAAGLTANTAIEVDTDAAGGTGQDASATEGNIGYTNAAVAGGATGLCTIHCTG